MHDVADVRVSGWWPLQHHEPGKPLAARKRAGAVRLHPPESGALEETGLGPDGSTYGTVEGGLFWPEATPGTREFIDAWWLTGPGVVSTDGGSSSEPEDEFEGTQTRRINVFGGGPTIGDGGSSSSGWLPLRGPGTPDVRFGGKRPGLPPFARDLRFPTGWTGTVSAGTDEDSQQESLHPDFWGLIAVNKGGDPACGSFLYDLDDSGAVSRSARYQTAWSVVRMPGVPGAIPLDPAVRAGLTHDSIAWQIGRGGRLDGGDGTYRKPGYGLVADYDAGEVGYAAAARGGPWTLGNTADEGGCTKHAFWGETDDGYAIRPVHNTVDALWIMDSERDGRLAFEHVPYLPAVDLPVIVHGHLRWRDETQQWQVQSSSVFFNEGPPPGGDPPPPGGSKPRRDPPPFFPPPPGTRVQPPPEEEEEKPRTGLTETSDGTYVYVWDANGNLVEQRRVKGGVLTKPGDALIPVTEGAADGPAETSEPPAGVTPIIGGEGDKPTHPASANYIQVPGLIVRGAATATGQLDPTGAKTQTAETKEAFAAAPQVGYFAGMASGDGTWGGFSTYESGSSYGYPKATGMILALPPDVTVGQVADGTAETESALQVGYPTGLSEIAFGTPNPTTGRVGSGVTCKGYAGGMLISMVDGDGVGVVGGPSMLLGEGGTDFTGNVSVSGKLTVAGRLDPTTLEFTDQTTDDIPNGTAGLRYNSASNVRPIWKQKAAPYTQGPLALYSDIAAAAGKTRLLYGTDQATGTSLTYSMPASTMDANGDVLVIYGRGITGASGTDTVRLRLGVTTLFTHALAGGGDPWEFNCRIIRTGASAQVFYRSGIAALSTAVAPGSSFVMGARGTATEALTSGTLDIVLDYSTANEADRIVHYLEVELREAP